jgi:malic enzyme
MESIKPTTIIGVSTIGGAFTQKAVETMSRIDNRPVVLALSNPTKHAECTAEQAYTWSKGKAIYAAGVAFPPGRFNGQTFLPGQANNFYIFPAVGMAIFATQVKRVTDEMFIEAARAVADQVPSDLFKQAFSIRCNRTFSRPRSRRPREWQSSSSIWTWPGRIVRPTSWPSSVSTSTARSTKSSPERGLDFEQSSRGGA